MLRFAQHDLETVTPSFWGMHPRSRFGCRRPCITQTDGDNIGNGAVAATVTTSDPNWIEIRWLINH